MNGKLWILQAFSGIALILLLGAHLLANHTREGLLTYDGVIQRFQDPLALSIEVALLLAVVFHAFNGLRNVLSDVVTSPAAMRWVSGVLVAAGATAAVYGVWLSVAMVNQ